MKMIKYSFNVENFIKNEALFVQSLKKYFWSKTNSLLGYKNQYLVTICINLIQNWPNSLWQTKYRSYLAVNGHQLQLTDRTLPSWFQGWGFKSHCRHSNWEGKFCKSSIEKNLGQVFNSRSGCMHAKHLYFCEEKMVPRHS